MKAHRRPQLTPSHHWYVAAYRRAVWRTIAVLTLTFTWYHLRSVQSGIRRAVLTHHPEAIRIGIYFDLERSLIGSVQPFSIWSPIGLRYVEYVGNVLTTGIGPTLLLAAVLAVAVHVSER